MNHSVTLPKVSVVAAYLSQDQYQKRVESSPHAPESMKRPRPGKYGLSLDSYLNELVSTTKKADNHTSENGRNICVLLI